ncbi:MAG: DNA topoisomerase IV [Flavobacteriales bacterium]|nr:DNA topoisomerase IV [Flavobacteriales bacterium]|tara:strand:- start:4038 stop:6695 length:2658 start_codon:yes stop_codon:yes gene_type:complete
MNRENPIDEKNKEEKVIHVFGMYQNWFLDYASYVILERAVPNINDGLKPVQRRILHSLKELDDGRYHKVANVIGHTMKYHPHGDASIGDAMVQIGQKELLLDMQGNWGNLATGDRAAAPRYIEVRLTPFALDVVYNKKITHWRSSYDGRGREPQTLPVKFPLLLVHGVEGIAVGLSTKILPHNFNELIDASIKVLNGIKPKIFPDFFSGGSADFSNYNNGMRGGKVRVRAKITQEDRNTLIISELPFSTNTSSLINSILKANDKGKIKIKKIEDNTAENVEISVSIPSGISPDKTIDALYRFTDCEISISPLACIIEDNTPKFMGVSEILQHSTNYTLELLTKELEVNLSETQDKWHFASLERIFIENRIYHKIEELDSWQKIISTIHTEINPYIKDLIKEVSDEDIEKLTEIKIKKITKFDLDRAREELSKLEERIKEIKGYLANITDYAIDYFKSLKSKYGKDKKRRTEIRTFESIDATKVVVANKRLYVNREEGFIGTTMRKDEFISDCSDIDDIIVFRKNGYMQVVKVDSKVFVGKDIIHCAVFKKKDERTIYNMIYKDGLSGNTMMKRFPVTSITRNKEYQVTKSDKGSKIIYFTANPNGEAEKVTIHLRKLAKLKTLKMDIDFAELSIKGKGAGGNILTKKAVKKVELKSIGISTLSARKIWFDDTVQRLNVDERGELLGAFKSDDKILTIHQSGDIELKSFDISNHFDEDMILIEKNNIQKPISAIYYNKNKKSYYVKRFLVSNTMSRFNLMPNDGENQLEVVTTDWHPQVEIIFVKEKGKERQKKIINLQEFISIKGEKSLGNKLTSKKVKEINLLEPLPFKESLEEDQPEELNTKENIGNTKSEIKITDKLKKDQLDGNEKSEDDEYLGGQITLEL